jgi:hypothetical protein
LKKEALSRAKDNKQRRCLGGNPRGVCSFSSSYFRIYIFSFSLHFTLHWGQCKFKCGGGDFGCVLNLFSIKERKKKKKEFCSLFLWFSTIFGCVCHEQDSIKLEKFIT